MTEVDFQTLPEYPRYKLMASLIVPRPIALVTTLGENGIANAAPFSMFNMLGEDPPIVMLSINRLEGGQLKHTAANILHNGEFVVHMSDEPMAQKMHDCGEAFPADVSELSKVGLTPVPAHRVAPPRIAESPVAFECVLHEKLETDSRYVFIGRIKWLAARDGLVELSGALRTIAVSLTNNKDGFTSLLAVVAPNLLCKPATVMFNKVTIKNGKQATQMFGPAQRGVAMAVADCVEDGTIPVEEADDLFVSVGVFIHWEAADDKKIYQYNYQATKMAIHAAMVDRMDREIGRILDLLRKEKKLDNTLVVFLSDNGASAEGGRPGPPTRPSSSTTRRSPSRKGSSSSKTTVLSVR